MASTHSTAEEEEQTVAHEFRFFRVYKDGRIEFSVPVNTEKVPASDDPITGVRSKDVHISSVSARIFLPKLSDPLQKLPLLFHIHGGGFCMLSAASPHYHAFCTALAALARAVIVSVEYGLFPARPIPACYEDSWAALQWVAAHSTGTGPDPWLNRHVDFGRVFIGGHSAGGNISHALAVRVAGTRLPGVEVVGMFLAHPFFGGTGDDSMWLYMCPVNGGLEDPRLKPAAEDLARIGCDKVLIFVAEKDHLNVVGKKYCEDLKKSGWSGNYVDVVEHFGEDHVFHLRNSSNPNSIDVMNKIASFLNQV